MEDSHGLFSCMLLDSKDHSRNKTSEMTGVHLEEEKGRPYYHIPCIAPEWDPKWTSKADIVLYFNKQQQVAYRGSAGHNSLEFKQAIFTYHVDAKSSDVRVTGVGFDKTAKYACVFKFGNTQKEGKKDAVPDSTTSINCGRVPGVYCSVRSRS